MRDSITISGKTYELATNAYTPIAYKEQFGKDYFQDLFSMVSTQSILDKIEHLNEEENLETGDIDLSILTNFDMTFFTEFFGCLLNLLIQKLNHSKNSLWRWRSFQFKK